MHYVMKVLFRESVSTRTHSWEFCSGKMKLQPNRLVFFTIVLFVIYRVTTFRYEHSEMEARMHPLDTVMIQDSPASIKVDYLPRGIVEARSDMELKPLWLTKASETDLKDDFQNHQNLLAIPVGIKQKKSVDLIIQKFISENFTVILFHYDGEVNGWDDLQWSNHAIHIVAQNQTKWWFAKRFLHPDVVSIYDYIFLWDEDLGVENFDPRRYLNIIKSEGLEISQPALDPYLSSEIHHTITVRKRKRVLHRRIYGRRGDGKCSNDTVEPPCTGWVEGMAPVFSRAAWHCVWHLIQNDLIHGWGMDMKLGYCAQGDPRKKVGVIDSEYIVHRGIQTLGGSSEPKFYSRVPAAKSTNLKRTQQQRLVRRKVDVQMERQVRKTIDVRTESRRRAKSELQIFQDRWERATRADRGWVDPFSRHRVPRRGGRPRKGSRITTA